MGHEELINYQSNFCCKIASSMSNLLALLKQPKFAFLVLVSISTLIVSTIVTIKFFPQDVYLSKIQTNHNQPQVLAAQTTLDLGKPPEDLKELNILLLGYGGAGHQGGFLTDVIQLVSINFETKKIYLISIPRDLWVTLPNGKQAKVNSAFTLGENPDQKIESGGLVAKQMISIVTGFDIHYFIAVDFVDFQRLIGEKLDGITVNVPETLDDPWYPIKGEELNPCGFSSTEIADLTAKYSGFELEKQFECRYKHLHFEKGAVQMEGGDALEYVRSRHGSTSGDFSRSQRQHALLLAIRDRLLEQGVIENSTQFFEAIQKNITTDLNLEAVKYAMPALANINNFQTQSLVLSTENVFTNGKSTTGQFILMPKQGLDQWQQVHEFIQKSIGK